jgi:hypothetical protein
LTPAKLQLLPVSFVEPLKKRVGTSLKGFANLVELLQRFEEVTASRHDTLA